jgi:dihydrofolate synthase/folylpolyglutamate synthase
VEQVPPGYPELLQRLFAARRSGVRLELDRVVACLDRLGAPQRTPRLRVHIGGTNGKGSTAAFVEAMLRAAGARVGVFTSPHVNRFEERFRIDGTLAEPAAILAAGERVQEHIDDGDPLTFFEQATVIALQLFADAAVDVAVLEVGIGGRYDATNAVRCEVAAVTGVALEHQQYLGTKIHHIAARKAGIFSRGQHAVIGAAGEPEAIPVLRSAAERAGVASLTIVDDAAVARAGRYELGLAGAYQRINAACALALADAVSATGTITIDEGARERGLIEARIPGRFEIVGERPRVILDGAHNPAGARALCEALAAIDVGRVVLVTGVSGGKDVAGLLGPLADIAAHAVVTRAREPRALATEVVAEALMEARSDLPVERVGRVDRAVARARAIADEGDTIVVAGSLFVVGEAREVVCDAGRDPLPLTDPM